MKQPNGTANFQDIEMYHWRVNFKPDKFYVATASDAMKGFDHSKGSEIVIQVIRKARFVTLQHLPRSHGTGASWVFKVSAHLCVLVEYLHTKQQCADPMA
jgi:hypothetical protein